MPIINKEDIKIEPTDYYVRFLPKDEKEYKLIKKDTTLFFYDYPLDREVIKRGDAYHDPSIPDDQPTWQYTVVKPDYTFPDVKYEIIKKIFVPKHSLSYKEGSEDVISNALEGLETISLYLTDNLLEKDKKIIEASRKDLKQSIKDKKNGVIVFNEQARTTRTCWWFFGYHCSNNYYPSGRIRARSEEGGSYVGIQGLRVKAKKWYDTYTCFTDSNGYFESPHSFKGSFEYTLNWERYEFEVKSGWGYFWGVASCSSDSSTTDKWNLNLDVSDKTQLYYATIFRAAYHYYYKYIKGLRRPKKNCSYCNKLSIRAEKNDALSSHHFDTHKFFGEAEVYINVFNKEIDEIYATTIHELAHAAHSEHFDGTYNSLATTGWISPWFGSFFRNQNLGPGEASARRTLESWATGVEFEITRMVYPKYKSKYNTYYTAIVRDLIDTDKDNPEGSFRKFSIIDKVSGFTIKDIEDTLRATSNWEGWKNNVKKKYYSKYPYTKMYSQRQEMYKNIDLLFDYYEQYGGE